MKSAELVAGQEINTLEQVNKKDTGVVARQGLREPLVFQARMVQFIVSPESAPIKAGYSTFGSQPEEAMSIKDQAPDRILGQSIPGGKMGNVIGILAI